MRTFISLLSFFTIVLLQPVRAQTGTTNRLYSKADTLRGTVTPERAWWDVMRYEIKVKPDYNAKTIAGSTVISYKVTNDSYPAFMQIDLQEPLIIDSVVFGASRQ